MSSSPALTMRSTGRTTGKWRVSPPAIVGTITSERDPSSRNAARVAAGTGFSGPLRKDRETRLVFPIPPTWQGLCSSGPVRRRVREPGATLLGRTVQRQRASQERRDRPLPVPVQRQKRERSPSTGLHSATYTQPSHKLQLNGAGIRRHSRACPHLSGSTTKVK